MMSLELYLQIMKWLEPFAQFLGMTVIHLLCIGGVIYLIYLFRKPILMIAGCSTFGYLVYQYVLMVTK